MVFLLMILRKWLPPLWSGAAGAEIFTCLVVLDGALAGAGRNLPAKSIKDPGTHVLLCHCRYVGGEESEGRAAVAELVLWNWGGSLWRLAWMSQQQCGVTRQLCCMLKPVRESRALARQVVVGIRWLKTGRKVRYREAAGVTAVVN